MKGSLIRAGVLLAVVLLVIWHVPKNHSEPVQAAVQSDLAAN